jgi:hypothetical protein
MYRCPRCNVELSPDARFCPRCGFNQTNARMQKVVPQQEARTFPPQPAQNEPASTPVLPPIPPTLGIRKKISSTPVENIRQQENKDAVPSNAISPVKTNTPPRPGNTASATPPSGQATAPEKSRPPIDTSAPSTNQEHPHAGERPKDTKLEDKQPSAEDAKPQGFSLTKRYMSEQETRHQTAFPVNNAASIPTDISPARQMQNEATPQPLDIQRGIVAMPTIPHPNIAQDFDPFTGEGAESLIATSKAAEHWRQSWRDRQHDEAGPAVGITRGQADVPEPLMAMQHSIARMRAIILPKNTGNTPGKNFGFWVTLILLLCIIGGLCAYVISTYIPSAQLAAQISGAGSVSPTLILQGTHTNTIKAGQTLHLHGTYFGPNHTITFILDTTSLATNPVQSNAKGAFDASLTIPATWLTGSYALQAQDNQGGLHAFLDLQILPGTPTMSNNTPLVLTINAQPLPTTGMAFQAVMGKINETSQRITFTNSGNVPVQWSASALADNNLNWLVINDGHIGGTLDSQGTDSIGISVNTVGLTSSTKPYLGSFILTVNQTQVIVPVSLRIQNTSLEVVVNPNPVIAYLQGGAGTCKPTTLTLINLSSQVVTWNANPFDVDKPHIHLDNLTTDQGTLDPEGLPNDTKVIQITCIGAQAGEKLYHISVYYNGVAVNVPVTVRFA